MTGIFFFFPCNKSVSCQHQGIGDVKSNCETPNHKRNLRSWKKQISISFAASNTFLGSKYQMLKLCLLVHLGDVCINSSYKFDKSSKRKGKLVEYAEFCDQNYQGVLKYISVH